MTLAAGPYEQISVTEGARAPFYLLRYDKDGRAAGPRTQEHLIDALESGDFTDVYVFSHGWNNDFSTALSYYRNFIVGYGNLRRRLNLDYGRPYRPLLAGIVWPSTALVLPWEEGPSFAGGEARDELSAGEQVLIEDLAADVAPSDRDRFYELVNSDQGLSEAEALELATLAQSVFADGDSDVGDEQGPDPGEFVASWAAIPQPVPETEAGPADFGDFGTAGTTDSAPDAALELGKFDPRNALRMLTVWKMKDRAGKVGALGVGGVLRDGLAKSSSEVRFHLIGHSYGARVLLSALAYRPVARQVDSLLLLQPAVSHLCFADLVQGSNRPGGYRDTLIRVKKPILATFSAHDFPLTKIFHLTLRRSRDLGEAEIAAGEPPNVYAALGGFGPRGLGHRSQEIKVKTAPEGYDLGESAPEVYGVDATSTVGGHGDVSNQSTWWALHCLVKG
ncbi:MAG: hypothetical protein ACRDWA_01850 [Acidimicrobiia bacterium]